MPDPSERRVAQIDGRRHGHRKRAAHAGLDRGQVVEASDRGLRRPDVYVGVPDLAQCPRNRPCHSRQVPNRFDLTETALFESRLDGTVEVLGGDGRSEASGEPRGELGKRQDLQPAFAGTRGVGAPHLKPQRASDDGCADFDHMAAQTLATRTGSVILSLRTLPKPGNGTDFRRSSDRLLARAGPVRTKSARAWCGVWCGRRAASNENAANH
ncbi:hypothetical protein [Bradyrhizobium sp. AZCC 2230]|uniref:hypothetical protein n=1 Tax=Bradyrhizobium sp. AZCC 2230 TaxID=3117021 RepID=UPI002FF00F89